VCSNYLCDATPGTEVKMTGPSGKVMLMPEATPAADIIMVATGTGIAPYRAFWKRLFVEKTPAAANFKGLAWLFLGVANSDALLYDDELQVVVRANPCKLSTLRIFNAVRLIKKKYIYIKNVSLLPSDHRGEVPQQLQVGLRAEPRAEQRQGR